jgi:hypothetical protein
MRHLPTLLAHIAALVAGDSGCSTGSCDHFVPTGKTIDVTGDVACAIANEGPNVIGPECGKACGTGSFVCTLPDDYLRAYAAAQTPPSDAAVDSDGSEAPPEASVGASAALCPGVTGTVKVGCADSCTGRRTEGAREPIIADQASAGTYFAVCSYLEAVSVYAFARLRAELETLGAPAALVLATRRAEKDEVRHAKLMRALARRFGFQPETAEAPPSAIRTRLAIARENAVEGCVRETYGAVLGLIGATRALDPQVRAVMRSIAHDECDHAALSWRVGQWMMSQLDDPERRAVRSAMREAVSQLWIGEQDWVSSECRVLCGMPTHQERRRIVGLLDRALFRPAALV